MLSLLVLTPLCLLPQDAPAEAAPAWTRTVLRHARMTRTTDTDETGHQRILIVTDDGAVRDDAHGLETDATCTEDWRIHPDDPLSAECRIVWECHMRRGDWHVRMRSEASLTADRTHWHPRAKLETWEGETPTFSRVFASDIPRDGI